MKVVILKDYKSTINSKSYLLDKYDESIKFTYNYACRIFMNLKSIIENYRILENEDEITLEVYRYSIIKIMKF